MKNFQDWLNCKLYSSHLKNLQKIKQDIIYIRSQKQSTKILKYRTSYRNKFHQKNENPFPPTQKHQKKHPLDPLKTSIPNIKLIKQNIQLANRLLNVSSVISKTKQLQSYNKCKSLFKKNSNSTRYFNQLKLIKFNHFVKNYQSNFIQGLHKILIKFNFQSLPKIPHGSENIVWIQLLSGTQKVNSDYYSESQILSSQIIIPLKKRADRHLVLLLHCSRGLQYINLGQYYIDCPKKGTSCQFDDIESCHDSRQVISLSVAVQELGRGVMEHRSVHLHR